MPRAAVRSEAHHLAAFVPIGEDVARHPAVDRAETFHVVKFVAEESAFGIQPDLLQRFEFRAGKFVIALRLASQRIDIVRQLTFFGDVRAVTADAVHHHHHAFIERAGRERAIGMRDMMRHRHDLVGLRPIERIFCRLHALLERHVRHRRQADLDVLDRQDVTIAHDQFDVVQRDAFGVEAIVDHFLVKTRVVLFARDPLLGNGEGDFAVAQQARADVVIVGVDPKNIAMALRH